MSFNATNISHAGGLASTVSAVLDGIQFNAINVDGGAHPSSVVTYEGNAWHRNPPSSYEILTIVNAVDIDWNGAVIPNGNLASGTSTTINSTGELLSLIDEMQAEIYVLAAAVSALAAKS